MGIERKVRSVQRGMRRLMVSEIIEEDRAEDGAFRVNTGRQPAIQTVIGCGHSSEFPFPHFRAKTVICGRKTHENTLKTRLWLQTGKSRFSFEKVSPGLEQPYRPGVEWMFWRHVLPHGIPGFVRASLALHSACQHFRASRRRLSPQYEAAKQPRRLSPDMLTKSAPFDHDRSVPVIEHLTLVCKQYRRLSGRHAIEPLTEPVDNLWTKCFSC